MQIMNVGSLLFKSNIQEVKICLLLYPAILLSEAKIAYFNSLSDRNKSLTTKDNNYSIHAISTHILTTTALEAFINEVCFGYPFGMNSRKICISDD